MNQRQVKELDVTRDEVEDRFLDQVTRDYTDDEYALLVHASYAPWEDRLRQDEDDSMFLQIWRQTVPLREEIILDGLATAIESQSLDR